MLPAHPNIRLQCIIYLLWIQNLSISMQMLLTPKDLSFVGYTYKNFDAVKGRHHFDPRGDSGADYTTKQPAEGTEVEMLASSGDLMLP